MRGVLPTASSAAQPVSDVKAGFTQRIRPARSHSTIAFAAASTAALRSFRSASARSARSSVSRCRASARSRSR